MGSMTLTLTLMTHIFPQRYNKYMIFPNNIHFNERKFGYLK